MDSANFFSAKSLFPSAFSASAMVVDVWSVVCEFASTGDCRRVGCRRLVHFVCACEESSRSVESTSLRDRARHPTMTSI
ncbi:hypothetical protein P153DRAFT_135078 [Dothidotthia symphoricarpi CBS 119687]|uniref:Uncharacterized protein n=1 Tax=Dothidotthia symphoricarpi CBS 119687 TaxID=1392245 RepID=A0A6A5ZZ86_9PLEO|nr:uncharacterized protein P153DRAFT_135078 [Dothidotthia symphoricarpi CBS 119687]KAF2124596.1 hypothetical protein P153DRAFT_135078 [Dothidotthia symphoricarpi CBS 119687]